MGGPWVGGVSGTSSHRNANGGGCQLSIAPVLAMIHGTPSPWSRPMTLTDLERHPLFCRAYWLRNLYIVLTLGAQFGLLWLLATIRVSHPGEGDIDLLGFSISFELFSWGTAWRIAVFLVLQLGLGHYQ